MKVFLSYSHTDTWQVRQIAELLNNGGHDAWYDTDLMPGQDWQQAIQDAITACEVFAYILSPESVASKWCQWEFAKAIEQSKPIVPILIQTKTSLPESISKHQYVDFSQGITPETAAKLMGGLMQYAISVPEQTISVTEPPSEGKPARAEAPEKHAFISYSRVDTPMMTQVRDRLKAENIPVWTDESIKTGAAHWQTVIEEAIENSGCIVVLLSPDAKKSEWVRREIAYARAQSIDIVPILIRGDEQSSIPFDVTGMQLADLQKDYDGGIKKLIDAVRPRISLADKRDTASTRDTVIQPKDADKFGASFWTTLMRVMQKSRCTPFIGSGVDRGLISSREEIARAWANKHDYPFASGYERDLARVGHFVTINMGNPFLSKDEFIETWLGNLDPDEVLQKTPSYTILASLDFPVYITTTYHDVLYHALQRAGKQPQRVFWSDEGWQSSNGTLRDSASVQEPMIFHLYGHQSDPDSIILTEDDYLNLLVRFAQERVTFPTAITDVIGKTSYLFVGFTVTDWNLRILFHILSHHGRTGRGPHIAVQVEPVRSVPSEEHEDRVKRYLEGYFRDHIGPFVDVYIGDTPDFITELDKRWKKANNTDG